MKGRKISFEARSRSDGSMGTDYMELVMDGSPGRGGKDAAPP